MTDLNRAKALLAAHDYTCVLCRGDEMRTATQRGVRPLLDWVESGTDCRDFSAADRVVGRGAAFLYCLLGVKAVYARVMSQPAREVLLAHGIAAEAHTLTQGIVNRTGTGPCPFEAAVLDIQEPAQALTAIQTKMAHMTKGV